MTGLPRTIDFGDGWGGSLNVSMSLGKCQLTLQMSYMDYSSLIEANNDTTSDSNKLMSSYSNGQVWKLYDYDNLMNFEDMISKNSLEIDTMIYYKHCNVQMSVYKTMFETLLDALRWNVSEYDVYFDWFNVDYFYFDEYGNELNEMINNGNVNLLMETMDSFVNNLKKNIDANEQYYKEIHMETLKNVHDDLIDFAYHPNNIKKFKDWGLIDNCWNM